jgi:hypothetical protein
MGIAKVILDSILGLGRFSWSGLKATSYMSYSLTKNTLKQVTNIKPKGWKSKLTFNGIKATAVIGTILTAGYFTAYKPFKNFADEQNDKIKYYKEKINRLEFNDYLGNGYFSFKASTERQRAQNLLDQSNFSGRELLGTEAEHYA